jgi:hypothetical protein
MLENGLLCYHIEIFNSVQIAMIPMKGELSQICHYIKSNKDVINPQNYKSIESVEFISNELILNTKNKHIKPDVTPSWGLLDSRFLSDNEIGSKIDYYFYLVSDIEDENPPDMEDIWSFCAPSLTNEEPVLNSVIGSNYKNFPDIKNYLMMEEEVDLDLTNLVLQAASRLSSDDDDE